MASYSIPASNINQTTPTLPKGLVTVKSTVPIYWAVGENPIATNKSALLAANNPIKLNLPVKCSKIAVLAVDESGFVSVSQVGPTKASCSL